MGRVLGMGFTQRDKLSKMIPVEGVKPVSITKALADEPRLREAAGELALGIVGAGDERAELAAAQRQPADLAIGT